jgi:hypothetical protein
MRSTIHVLVVCGVFAVSGCQDNGGGGAERDRHPKPEGRMQIDQSAVLPVDVKAGVARDYPGATVQKVSKRTFDDRVVRYDVTLTTKDGREVTQQFDADGKASTK